MNFATRLTAVLGSMRKAWEVSGAGLLPVTLSENRLEELATEMDGYVQVGGTRMDLRPWDQQKMQTVALHLFRHNHMAKRLLEIIIDFVVGDGITVAAKHEDEATKEKIQEIIDRFWQDPINDMDRNNPQRLMELNLWGEIVMPCMVNEVTGQVRLGWIDPANIVQIHPDPVTKKPGRIELTEQAAREVGARMLEVVRFDHNEGRMIGNTIFGSINTVLSGRRGVSEYFSSSDWFDILDETMKVASDRSKLLLSFVWDWTLEGKSEEEIKDWLKQQTTPRPNTIIAHNEKVQVEAKAPDLKAYEMSRHTKDLKTYILGGFGYPNHWFGSGEDANLATAAVMAEPTRKALKRKTRQFTYMLADTVRFALSQAKDLPAGVDPMGDLFEINVPDIGGPDVAKVGSALQQITGAITAAVDGELVSEETGRLIFASIASLTGVEIDPQDEVDKLEAEKKAREEKAAQEFANQADQIAMRLMGPENPPPNQPATPPQETVPPGQGQ